jgi:hypothetical protein
MEKAGEKSFPVYSASSIVVIEHEMRRSLRLSIDATYREIHEKKGNNKVNTMLSVTTGYLSRRVPVV